jgi:signal transduction histidine kinase
VSLWLIEVAVPKPGARHPARFNIPDWTPCMISGMKRLVFLCALIGMLILLPVCAAAQTPTKRVLILTGSDPNYPGFSTVTRKIVSTLRGGWQARVEVLYELQEGLVEPAVSPGGDEELASYLKLKYADKKVDLILSLQAPRLRILLQKEPGLFGKIPKIFYEFESEREAINLALGPNITGVWVDLDLNKTLDLALALHPDTRKVVVVSGNGAPDELKRERAQVEFRKYEKRAEFSYLKADTIEDLKGELAALDKKSVVIFLMFTRDKAGNRYSGPEAISMIAPSSNAPIYGYSDTYMGFGITGGNLLDFEAIGRRIGEMSLRVLAGERPEQIPQETGPTVMTVDWRELQRWGVSERSLPPGSVVRFRQPSIWELYKWRIIAVLVFCVLQAMLIAVLLVERRKRQRAVIERERAAEELQKTHNDLAHVARLTAMGEMAASIAHEVNQPLAAIATYGDACALLLSGESPNVKKSLEAIDHIIKDSIRASEVVKRIRTLVKKTSHEMTPQDLNQIIREMVAVTEADVLSRSIQLELILAQDLPSVLGDSVELQQVVLNLILNGIEAMNEVTDRVRELTITSSMNGGGQVVVTVQDSGVGLNSEQQKRIFDPFVTTKPKGLGLGLSISRTILEGHGGRLWAEPNQGPGARFQFTLPTVGGSDNGH